MTDKEAKTLGELALKADMLRRQCRDIEEKMKEQRAAMRRMAKCILAELAIIMILAFAAAVWKG
uniref:hypothetical protein n=1 Tax=Dialister sp. TaxID=1955814 RepID=UPI004029C90D